MIPATDRRPDLRRRGAIEAPLSSSQRGLWFVHATDPNLSAYAVPLLLHFPRRVAVPALRTALAALPARHEPLRTHYPLRDDELVQRTLHRARHRFGWSTSPAFRRLRNGVDEHWPDIHPLSIRGNRTQ